MQKSDAQEKMGIVSRLGTKNILWMSVSLVLLLTALGAGLYAYRNLPTSRWREVISPTLPWQGEGIQVQDINAHWRNSQGHARMELRAAYYPVANIRLGEGTGSGTLLIRFVDSSGDQVGDPISLPYEGGNFLPTRDHNIRAEGKEAEIFVESGFPSRDDFALHRLTETSPLWRVILWNRPADAPEERFVGYISVSPVDK